MKHLTMLVACLLCACSMEAAESEEVARVGASLDNSFEPGETACYQDIPDRKGKMEYGLCCFDDPKEGTSVCITCDKEHRCTVGGAEPGALTGGVVRPPVVIGGGLVLDPKPPLPPKVFKNAVGASTGALSKP